MEEKWKGIIYNGEDISDFYEISNFGKIRNSRTKRVLKQNINQHGYKLYVGTLGSRSKTKGIIIHRAVAEAFIPNPENKPQVNHIDGNKENNCVDNLEWVTNKENVTHAIKTGLQNNSGEHNGKAKLTQQQAEEIRKIRKEKNVPYRQIAKKYNVSHYTIIQICKNRYYK